MPTYTILDKSSGEEADIVCTWEELLSILAEDDNLEQVFKMNLAYRIERLKVSEAWRDKLKAMKKANPRSTIEVP